ncbi:uncharacterized protein HKW66_Vig0093230 [Vigna angularis]|uniref:Uncharacterized protein n=1 Tax=Phaseolus angularis TaxID=3914 RepID=A0A8T0KR97_PHAAN|nr:uncharacterized protein HKW66_Vig0093230 [Vigna angularis]
MKVYQKVQSPNPVQFSSKTPEKLLQRNRTCGVALSVADIKEVGKGLQDRKRRCETASSPPPSKSVRRQILQWSSSPSKSKSTDDDPYKLPERYKILDQFLDRLNS